MLVYLFGNIGRECAKYRSGMANISTIVRTAGGSPLGSPSMIAFWGLMVMLAVAWSVTTSGAERWWGLAMFGLVSAILALAKWVEEHGPTGPEGR